MKKVEIYVVMPVLTVVLLSVILGTSEFIIIGILPDIAQSIGASLTMIGNLVLTFTVNQVVLGLINIFIIAITMYFVNAPLQMHFLNRAMKIRPEALNLSPSILPLAFNIGIAICSGIGSLLVTYTEM